MLDFLRPIGDDNREEIFLISYEGYIKNMGEELILKMKLDEAYWISRFPLIKEYFALSHLELYDATVFFSPEELLMILSREEDTKELYKEIRTKYLDYSVEDIRVSTAYSFAFKKIFLRNFTKKIYFVTKTPLNREDKYYLYDEIIRDKRGITEFYQCDTDEDIVELVTKSNPTTIFIDSFTLAENIDRAVDTKRKKDLLYMVRANSQTYHKDPESEVYIPNHTTEDYLKKGMNVVVTEIPSTGIDKTLSTQEPLG